VTRQASGKDALCHPRAFRELLSRLHALSLVVRALLVPVLVATTLVYWKRPPPTAASDLLDAGYAVCAITVVEWVATRGARGRARSEGADEAPTSTGPDEAHVCIDEEARRAWAEAAWLAFSGSAEVSKLAVLRVGERGVELLLHQPLPDAEPPFQSEAGGFVWTAAPSLSLDELVEFGRRLEEPEVSASLVEIGRDDDGTYFVDQSQATWVRLEEESQDVLEDRLPAAELKRADLSSSFGAPVVVLQRGNDLLLEPFGLLFDTSSRASGRLEGPIDDALLASSRPSDDTESIGESEIVADDGEEHESANAPKRRAEFGEPVAGNPLLRPGPVEVRILREGPDLVGKLEEEPSPAAVEFVAYLCLHNYRATTSRLKEALGTERSRGSRSVAAIWRAAGEARHALGPEIVPAASPQQAYQLSDQVSCDWMRFKALVELARAETADRRRRAELLIEAISLVEGVPGLSSRRFSWLDTEGVLAEIGRLVLLAGRELAAATDDEEIRRLAVGKARIFFPTDADLVRLATAH
jgi:hypothetical protein